MRERLPALVVALVIALLAIPTSYALLRGHDVLFGSEPNPALVSWSTRIAMFWRLAVGAFLALLVGPLAHALARADLDGALRASFLLLHVAAALLAIQGVFLP